MGIFLIQVLHISGYGVKVINCTHRYCKHANARLSIRSPPLQPDLFLIRTNSSDKPTDGKTSEPCLLQGKMYFNSLCYDLLDRWNAIFSYLILSIKEIDSERILDFRIDFN